MVSVTIKYMPHDGNVYNIIPGPNWSKPNIYIFGSLASKIGKVATKCPAGNKPFKRKKRNHNTKTLQVIMTRVIERRNRHS